MEPKIPFAFTTNSKFLKALLLRYFHHTLLMQYICHLLNWRILLDLRVDFTYRRQRRIIFPKAKWSVDRCLSQIFLRKLSPLFFIIPSWNSKMLLSPLPISKDNWRFYFLLCYEYVTCPKIISLPKLSERLSQCHVLFFSKAILGIHKRRELTSLEHC